MVPYASNFVEGVDWVFKLIIGISVFFLILITAAMVFFVIRYNKKRHPKATQLKDNIYLEVTWIGIPLIIVLFLFYYGFAAYQPMLWVPRDAMQVRVIGRMWQWSFEYPGDKTSTILELPLNKAVKLNLHSEDVIHGFSVPSFRVKQDVVPGKNNYMWFTPGILGDYEIFCTAYCGVRHSYMGTKVRVVPEAEFIKWLAALPATTSQPPGLQLLTKNGCLGCHSIDGSRMVSVTFKGLYGKQENVTTNGLQHVVAVNDEYIKTSLYDPNRDIVVGYPAGVMKTYKGIVSEDDLKKIIDYLKTLK
jgi:cytochrome c oxidase subunit II